MFFPLAKELLNSTVSSAPCVSCACFKCKLIRFGFGVRGRKRASGRTTRPNLRAHFIPSVIVRACKMCGFIRYAAFFTFLSLPLKLFASSACVLHWVHPRSWLHTVSSAPFCVAWQFLDGKCQIMPLEPELTRTTNAGGNVWLGRCPLSGMNWHLAANQNAAFD